MPEVRIRKEETGPLKWLKELSKDVGLDYMESAKKEAKRFFEKFDLVEQNEKIKITRTHLGNPPYVQLEAKIWLHEWVKRWDFDHNIQLIMRNTKLDLPQLPKEESTKEIEH